MNDRGSEVMFLTIRDVAERYQLHPETVRRWILEGRLPAVRLAGGSAWRIKSDDLSKIEEPS